MSTDGTTARPSIPARARGRSPLRSRLLATFLAAGLTTAVTVGVASAGHETEDVASYTGCLTSGGTLNSIRTGDQPARPCEPGAVVAHFSGGDITAIVAGAGLNGGAGDGEATLALAPSFQLPQTCTNAQVAKWNGSGWSCADDDSGSAYTAGEGLALNGTEFSVEGLYQLPQDCEFGQSPVLVPGLSVHLPDWGCTTAVAADQACPSGQFAREVDDAGLLGCAAPSSGGAGGSTAYVAVERNPVNGSEQIGILNDDEKYEMVRLNLPPGAYVLSASGVVSNDFHRDGLIAWCHLVGNGLILQEAVILGGEDDRMSESVSFTSAMELPHGGTVPVFCGAGSDGVIGEGFRIVATPVGSVG